MGNWNDTQEAYYGAQPDLSERPENKKGKYKVMSKSLICVLFSIFIWFVFCFAIISNE